MGLPLALHHLSPTWSLLSAINEVCSSRTAFGRSPTASCSTLVARRRVSFRLFIYTTHVNVRPAGRAGGGYNWDLKRCIRRAAQRTRRGPRPAIRPSHTAVASRVGVVASGSSWPLHRAGLHDLCTPLPRHLATCFVAHVNEERDAAAADVVRT